MKSATTVALDPTSPSHEANYIAFEYVCGDNTSNTVERHHSMFKRGICSQSSARPIARVDRTG
jgi:hypothetical protein